MTQNKAMMKSILVLSVFILLSTSSGHAQDFHQEIITYRTLKHQNFASNPFGPLRPTQLDFVSYYEPDATYRVEARVEILQGEEPFRMPTYDGTSNVYQRYALLHFSLGGQEYTLTTYQHIADPNTPTASKHLFLPFMDDTNGSETYGGGRYIDLNTDHIQNDTIVIDFNKAYNPYCAYSNGYRCPQPPLDNSLPIAILAGEKKYDGLKNERIVNKESAKGFSDRERELINQGSGKMHIYQTSDAEELTILRKSSEDIRHDDPLLSVLADRMLSTVQDEAHRGVGIAAPQVGINKNLIWVQRFDKNDKPFELYINPKIIWRSQLIRTGAEGCLSIPDLREDVQRSYTIRLQYWTKEGEIVEENVEGFTAVIVQHEVDHLYGILFPDRLDEQSFKTTIPLHEKIELSLPENSIVP